MEWLWQGHFHVVVSKENLLCLVKQLLKSITLENKIGHIFTVDIEFSNINPIALLFNEIFPPIFEKNKKIPPHLRSCSQIMSRAQKKELTPLWIKNFLLTFMQKIFTFWQLVLVGKLPKFMITLHLNKILLKETLLLWTKLPERQLKQ